MAEAEFANFSLNSSEYNYVNIRSSVLPRSKFSRRDVLIAVVTVGCLYLLNGHFAVHACTILTSVPAAIFTYKVLGQETSTQAGYRSILFYWVLQGGLSLLDVFLCNSYGYFFAKFVLMSLVFGHAISKNQEAFSYMINMKSVKEDQTQCMTSIVSMYDSEGYPVQSPWLQKDSASLLVDMALTPCPIYSNEVSMMSTQKNTPKSRQGINRALTPHPDVFLGDEDFYGKKLRQTPQTGDCLTAQESQCTVNLMFGDVITNPMERLVFLKPQETKTIEVTNISQHSVMWALKCNALHRLAASPACGVIPRGGREKISVMYRKGANVENGDKLAIDYAFVKEEQMQYTSNFLERTDKRRHLVRVTYEFE